MDKPIPQGDDVPVTGQPHKDRKAKLSFGSIFSCGSPLSTHRSSTLINTTSDEHERERSKEPKSPFPQSPAPFPPQTLSPLPFHIPDPTPLFHSFERDFIEHQALDSSVFASSSLSQSHGHNDRNREFLHFWGSSRVKEELREEKWDEAFSKLLGNLDAVAIWNENRRNEGFKWGQGKRMKSFKQAVERWEEEVEKFVKEWEEARVVTRAELREIGEEMKQEVTRRRGAPGPFSGLGEEQTVKQGEASGATASEGRPSEVMNQGRVPGDQDVCTPEGITPFELPSLPSPRSPPHAVNPELCIADEDTLSESSAGTTSSPSTTKPVAPGATGHIVDSDRRSWISFDMPPPANVANAKTHTTTSQPPAFLSANDMFQLLEQERMQKFQEQQKHRERLFLEAEQIRSEAEGKRDTEFRNLMTSLDSRLQAVLRQYDHMFEQWQQRRDHENDQYGNLFEAQNSYMDAQLDILLCGLENRSKAWKVAEKAFDDSLRREIGEMVVERPVGRGSSRLVLSHTAQSRIQPRPVKKRRLPVAVVGETHRDDQVDNGGINHSFNAVDSQATSTDPKKSRYHCFSANDETDTRPSTPSSTMPETPVRACTRMEPSKSHVGGQVDPQMASSHGSHPSPSPPFAAPIFPHPHHSYQDRYQAYKRQRAEIFHQAGRTRSLIFSAAEDKRIATFTSAQLERIQELNDLIYRLEGDFKKAQRERRRVFLSREETRAWTFDEDEGERMKAFAAQQVERENRFSEWLRMETTAIAQSNTERLMLFRTWMEYWLTDLAQETN